MRKKLKHEQKTKNYTKEKWRDANDGVVAVFAELTADAITAYTKKI